MTTDPRPGTSLASEAPLRLEFTYTVEDLVEASEVHADPKGARRRDRGAGVRRVGLVGVHLLIAAALAVNVYSQLQPEPPRPPPGTTRPWTEMLVVAGPWAVFMGVIFVYGVGRALMFRRLGKAASYLYPADSPAAAADQYVAAPPRTLSPLYMVIAAIGVGAAVGVVTSTRDRVAAGGALLTMEAVRHLLPLVLLAFTAVAVARASGPSAARRAFRESRELQLPQVVDVSEESLTIANAIGRTEQRWEAYMRVVEGPNVFLLYPVDLIYTVIPKRAFPTPQALTEFRELVRRTIADRRGH